MQTMTATVQTCKAAEAVLVANLNATADALSGIGQAALDAALDRVKAQAALLAARLGAARQTVAHELAGVLAGLTGFAEDLVAGLVEPTAPPIAAEPPAALPLPVAVQVPQVSEPTALGPSPVAAPETGHDATPAATTAPITPDADKAGYERFHGWVEADGVDLADPTPAATAALPSATPATPPSLRPAAETATGGGKPARGPRTRKPKGA